MASRAVDFLVVGAGIVGICIARELRRRYPRATIVVLEKEAAVGCHASGRNSGVIHAGFYYTADSLKARFTRAGNIALQAYCVERGLPLRACGKLVVAGSEADHAQLDELLRRGARNGVPLESVTAADAVRIEPRAQTCGRAIYSPTTATADPLAVLCAMRDDASKEGVELVMRAAVRGRTRHGLATNQGEWHPGFVVNAAGLFADRIAREYGFSRHYRVVPFKGLYLYSAESPGAFRTNIYPVPDLRNPFLGVHFTVTVDGRAKIGPTAIPAFWREQYDAYGNFSLRDCFETLWLDLGLMFFSDFGFRQLAVEELAKYNRKALVALASQLASGVREQDYRKWGRPGIRAQLVDLRTRKLESDFVLEGDSRSMHVLNAVSPGWTCSIPFAAHVVDRIGVELNERGSLHKTREEKQ